MGGLYGKSMTSPRQIPGSPSRLRAQHRKLTAMRYYGNVMTTTIWRLRILHLQQCSRRLNLFVCFFVLNKAITALKNYTMNLQSNPYQSKKKKYPLLYESILFAYRTCVMQIANGYKGIIFYHNSHTFLPHYDIRVID